MILAWAPRPSGSAETDEETRPGAGRRSCSSPASSPRHRPGASRAPWWRRLWRPVFRARAASTRVLAGPVTFKLLPRPRIQATQVAGERRHGRRDAGRSAAQGRSRHPESCPWRSGASPRPPWSEPTATLDLDRMAAPVLDRAGRPSFAADAPALRRPPRCAPPAAWATSWRRASTRRLPGPGDSDALVALRRRDDQGHDGAVRRRLAAPRP